MVKKNSCETFIEKAVSCPPELIGRRVSRWGVAKVQVKDKLLRAAETMSRHSSFVSKDTMKKYTDGRPVVLVGPVIGLVTSTTARILLEVDTPGKVQIALQKVSHSAGNSDDHSNSVSQRLWRGVSSPAWLRAASSYKSSGAETGLINTIDQVDSQENSMHSSGDSSMQSACNDERDSNASKPQRSKEDSMQSQDKGEGNSVSSKLRRRKSSKIGMQRASSGSSRWEWSTTSTRRASPENALLGSSGYESPGNVSSTERRPESTSGAAFWRRRGSGSLWTRSSLSPSRSSLLSKQATQYLQQGGGEQSTLNVMKTMEARRPCVFEFKGLEPGSRYQVKVSGCNGSEEESSFKTFPHDASQSFCIASISCNSIFITNRTITLIDDLWSHLYKYIRSNKIDLLIHLGDQIYGDGDKNLDAGAGKDRDKWSNRFKIALDMLKGLPKEQWPSKKEEICEKYREVYRDTWKHPYTAKCLANCPSLMIYDDHEIRDNWGDNRVDRHCKESAEFFVALCAWLVTLEYQRQLYEDVDFSNLDEIQKDHYFQVIGKIGLMFLDIRGSRTFHRVEKDEFPYLGTRQWEDINQALRTGGVFDGVEVLVVCSPAPLVFLIPSLTRAAHNIIDRLEDFKGHWSNHKVEQKKMIECLRDWKKTSGREVIVLGGDVHCGGHSCILESDEILFYQLTTSPIANMPLSKTVYYAMRFAEQLEHIQDGFKFRHFNWTRARNYGLVQVNLRQGENKPEILTQLVSGKFLRPVRMGKRVSNLEGHKGTSPIQWCKTRMFNMVLRACEKTLLSDRNNSRLGSTENDDING